MTDLIALAKQAGATFYIAPTVAFSEESLQAFADLIRKDTFRDGYEKGIAGFMEAVKLEREQCADIVDNAFTPDCGGWTASGISDAIRARTTT